MSQPTCFGAIQCLVHCSSPICPLIRESVPDLRHRSIRLQEAVPVSPLTSSNLRSSSNLGNCRMPAHERLQNPSAIRRLQCRRLLSRHGRNGRVCTLPAARCEAVVLIISPRQELLLHVRIGRSLPPLSWPSLLLFLRVSEPLRLRAMICL